jgi:hypothetical protein
MTKLLLLLVVLVAAAALAYKFVPAVREARACSKLEKLCAGAGGAGEKWSTDCRQGFTDLRKAAGDETTDRAVACVIDSDSCGAAAGCVAGTLFKSTIGGFFDGVRRALE